MVGIEKTMYVIYQLFTLVIIIATFFIKVKINKNIFIAGLLVYIAGNILFILSTYSFEIYSMSGVSKKGMYKISRNPMYLSYFIYFLGIVLITKSIVLFIMVIIFQISSHWIILSEERFCLEEFGKEYTEYMDRVRRYI